ncbi:unnamed protein product [Adineta steineri]|uniref:Uncharacterized protein n=1 Tax=Adineta steineri TaxID=433720 RepID=A0A819LMK9_9BILA|nr:unnamed protein product [Adineta steineri]CAF3963478.1 unnamed protein product [Adineta steineri]
MVERMLSIRTNELDNLDVDKNHLSKGSSFNTDDDDSMLAGDSQQISDSESRTVNADADADADTDGLKIRDMKRALFGIHSASIDSIADSIQDGDGIPSDTTLADKIKRRQKRRATEQMNQEQRKSVVKVRPWYTKVDVTKPVMYVGIVILLYFAWTERDVWIPRLLTSNNRIRHIALANEEKLQEKDHSPPPSPSSSSSSSTASSDNSTLANSFQNDIDDDDDDDDDTTATHNANTDQTSNQDESSPIPTQTTNKAAPAKLNLRVRRNKMSFSNKERAGKKRRGVRSTTVDDDDEETDDAEDIYADDDLSGDDNPATQSDSDEPSITPTNTKETILLSSTESTHKHRQTNQRSPHVRQKSGTTSEKSRKVVSSTKTGLMLPTHDDIVAQLHKLIKSRHHNKDLLAALAKETGLKKATIKRFLEKKDFQNVSLDVLISFLDAYQSTLLIVPK